MKINPNYKLRTVGGKSLIISENTERLDGVMTLNETAELIWRMIEEGNEPDDIVKALADSCDVSENEIREDVLDFIEKLKKANIVID